MTEIQQNRYDRLIRRVANIVGGGSQVNDTLNELFPTIDVENVPGELLALAQTDLGWASTNLVASALNRNHHQLFNPAGSGNLIVVTQVNMFSIGGTQVFRLGMFIGALATLAGNERRRDSRAGVLASIVAQQRTDQSTVNGDTGLRVRVLSNVNEKVSAENGICILFPGTGLTVSTEIINIASTVSFMWRERVFEPAELVT